MPSPPRLLRITTVPISLKLLLRGQFTFFKSHGFEVLTVSADGAEVKDMIEDGITHQVVPMTRTITPVSDFVSLIKLIQVIRKFNPDIVHTHTPKAGLLGMMAAWVCRVPVRMHTVAGLPLMEATGVKKMILKITERITYACATNVYPNSKGLFDFIISEFQIPDSRFQTSVEQVAERDRPQFEIRNSKFKIIGRGSSNGIDSSFFSRTPELQNRADEIRKQYHIPEGAIVFSFVGRMVKDKGIVELITAFKMILKTREDAYLLLVGPLEQELDPLPAEVLDFIQQHPQVVAAGYQNDVRPWMVASDVFVFPSYREGFPNVVMQAACLEVPCIVSDINGCNEIIEAQVNGLIVPAKDAKALYEAMHAMMTDERKRQSFAKKSREFVSKNFDQQFVWGQLLAEYRRVLKQSEGSPNR